MSGKDLRAYALSALRNRSELMRKLMRARVGRFSDLVFRGRGNPVLLDGEICLDLFWPTEVPDFFEELSTPLLVVATRFSPAMRIRHVARPAGTGGRRLDGDSRLDSTRRLMKTAS